MNPYTTLIQATELAEAPGRSAWTILDCRFDLAKPGWGEAAYSEGHLPGALYAHLDRDLSSPVTATSGRHPLPDPARFAALAGRWGVDAGTQVIAYDQGNGMYAARAWWLFRWLGHTRVAVLDGGLAAWSAAGLPLTRAIRERETREFIPRPDASRLTDADSLRRALGAGELRLTDARGADRFAGQNETIDPVAGHVPGAINHPFLRNLDEHGRFLSRLALRERWMATLDGRKPAETVAMCGSGVSACHNLLALEHAGLPGARLYAGSWSEWIRDPSRPVTTGPQ
jgi:thiosulfate/3-mercaptopyruvate sulfurtransferase